MGRKKKKRKKTTTTKNPKEPAVGQTEPVLRRSLSKVADSCSTQAGTPVCFSRHPHSVFTISVFLMEEELWGEGMGFGFGLGGEVGSEHLNAAVIYFWFHEDVVPLTQNQ